MRLETFIIADWGSYVIRKVTPGGVVSIFAGSGKAGTADGSATTASFSHPAGMAIDGGGNIYVCDDNILIRKITAQGDVSTFAGIEAGFSHVLSLAVDGAGNVFAADQGAVAIKKITPTGLITTFYQGSGSFSPYALAIGKTGNIFVTDLTGNAIYKITPEGVNMLFAGGNAVPVDQDGTGTAASLIQPSFMTIDANGNLYVDDTDHFIRKITPEAVVSTFSGKFVGNYDGPVAMATYIDLEGITLDIFGNFYVIDGTIIRKISFQ